MLEMYPLINDCSQSAAAADQCILRVAGCSCQATFTWGGGTPSANPLLIRAERADDTSISAERTWTELWVGR